MDTFNFLIAVMLVLIAMQFNQTWLVFGAVAVIIIATRSISTTILLIITTLILYYIKASGLAAYWPAVLFGLIILALFFGTKAKPQEPEYFPADPYAGLMGGMGEY